MTDYSKDQYKGAIESILFTMGREVPVETLTAALELEREALEAYIAEMIRDYEREDRGIRIIKLENCYQMCTKKEYYEALIRIAAQPVKPVLTGVMLEVLSIVAYKQPVTRGEIERIRGVSSDYSVNRLIEYGLIEEAGRLEAPGRPILFGTTEEFLRRFGIESVTELPELSENALAEARLEVLREAGFEGQMSMEDYFGMDMDITEDNGPIEVEI